VGGRKEEVNTKGRAYDDIRAMVATIEAAGWSSLTQRAVDP
jgi:hypothetical protein